MNINIRKEEAKDYRRVEDFDKTFSYKEKRHEKSQDEYEATASMLDE